MVDRRFLLICMLTACITPGIVAAQNPIVEMNLLSVFSYGFSTEQWGNRMIPDLKLSISSENNGNVRGEISLGTPGPTQFSPTFDDYIRKAYLRARFPSFRLTAGKTRLSWGDGMLFNAGDILFGSSSTSVSLTQTELRSETDWMVSINYPLGFFSFAEAVAFPSKTGLIEDMGVGFRFYTNVGETKVEGGYLYKQAHRLYASLQGNIGPDWYLASSLSIATSNPSVPAIQDSFLISGGLFHMVYLPIDRTLSLRLEMLARPFGTWKWESQSDASCALLLYPELIYNPTSSLAFSLRSIISPLDLSALATIAASWSAFKGFSLIISIAAPLGESGDLFNWDGQSLVAITLGASWVY